MFSKEEVKKLLNELLEEEIVILGGMVAVHEVADDFVWELKKNLDQIRGGFLARIENKKDSPEIDNNLRIKLAPHPAIEHLLRKLRGSDLTI